VEAAQLEQVEGVALAESDDLLVARARRGDAGAYASLVLRYQDVAFRVAYIALGDSAEAEDAAQEAFIKAYYSLPRFRAGAPFRPWLLQIVANQARNRRRASGRRGALELRAFLEDSPGGGAGGAPPQEGGALIEERREALLQAVNGLRVEDRVVVAYRYFFDLSEADMASALGCARGTVKSRLSRAVKRLRGILAGYEASQ
jgi:RNA polymerase sigma factor (sigma-70 family)